MTKETFKPISGYSDYLIDELGKVKNKKLNSYLQGSYSQSTGYFNVRLKGDDGKTKTWGLHRLLGYVFIPCEQPIEDMVINHIDGNKQNNRLSNLEWVTYQGNAEHAGENGLTDKCIPILVRDSVTGEITTYPSMVACAREFGLTKDAVSWRVKSKGQKVFPEKKQYMSVRSDESWLEEFDLEKEIQKNGRASPILVRFLKDPDYVMEFESATAVSKYLQVKLPTLSTWLARKDQPVLPGFLQLQKAVEATEWREVVDMYLDYEKFSGTRCVTVWNDHFVKHYNSAAQCCLKEGIKATALNYRLLKNTDWLWGDGLRYMYYSDFIKRNHGHSA